MLRRLYDWIMRLAESPRALWALAAVSFAESSFFPIPPDPMLIPMVLLGAGTGRWLVYRMSPRVFERLVVVFTVASTLLLFL